MEDTNANIVAAADTSTATAPETSVANETNASIPTAPLPLLSTEFMPIRTVVDDDATDEAPTAAAASKPVVGKKSVHFSADLYQIVEHLPSLDDMTKEERKDLWWRGRDIDGLKNSAKIVSKEIRLLSRGSGSNHSIAEDIDQGYDKAQMLAGREDDDSLYDLLQDESRSDLYSFQSWTAYSVTSTCRGLEQWVSIVHQSNRHDVIKQAKKIVLNIQNEETPDEVAMQYAEEARASRIVARWMAHADQLAVENDCFTSDQQRQSTTKRRMSIVTANNIKSKNHHHKSSSSSSGSSKDGCSSGSTASTASSESSSSVLSQYYTSKHDTICEDDLGTCSIRATTKTQHRSRPKLGGFLPRFR